MIRRLATFVVLVIHLALAGCGGGPATPEALFREVNDAMVADDQRRVWDLLTEDHRRSYGKMIEDERVTIRRNPGNDKMAERYQMHLDEFMTAPIVTVWVKHNSGHEDIARGMEVVRRFTDPQAPSDVILDVRNPRGVEWRWVVRQEPERGWRLQRVIGSSMPTVEQR